MVEKEEKNFRKYIGLYVSRYQKETFKGLERGQQLDIFWPFKFVWFILTSIWRGR